MTAKEILQQINEGFKQTLPSGLIVTMRRISIESYRRKGTLPTHLQTIVAEMRLKGIGNVYRESPDDAQTFLEWVICEALLDPVVAIEPTGDALPIDYLPEGDKLAIYQIAFGDIAKAIEAVRPLSKRAKASGSLISTPSPSATDSDPAV